MTNKNTIKKLVKKMLNKPTEMKFNDLIKVLEYFNFRKDNVRGSHFMYRKGEKLITVVHHKKRVKKTYIIRIIEILNLEEWYEKENE